MARPKNQDLRRSELRAAAGRALAERSAPPVRLKDIADAAGLAPASVLYYYPDVDVLVREAFVHAIERFSDRRSTAAAALDDPRDQLVETIRSGLPTGPDDEEVQVLYQSAGFVRRDPELASIVRRLTRGQVRLYRRILEAGSDAGVFELADDALAIAQNLVALEDAYGLYVIDVGMRVSTAQRALVSFASIATRCDLEARVPARAR